MFDVLFLCLIKFPGTGRGTSFCYLCDQSNADCNVVGEVDQDDVENTLFVCLCKPGYAGDGFVCESKFSNYVLCLILDSQSLIGRYWAM